MPNNKLSLAERRQHRAFKKVKTLLLGKGRSY